MSIVKTLLNVTHQAGWLSRLVALLRSYGNQPVVRYAVSPCDLAVIALLQKKGIRVWAIAVVEDTLWFQVAPPQAAYAQYWLENLGLLYCCEVERPAEANKAAGPAQSDVPKPAAQPFSRDKRL